jgi:phosphoribosylformylglycinamidine synthase
MYSLILSFFSSGQEKFCVFSDSNLDQSEITKLTWLLNASLDAELAEPSTKSNIKYIGYRANMTSPWSTNATTILSNIGISKIKRIERFTPATSGLHDKMLEELYSEFNKERFFADATPLEVKQIKDISDYNSKTGLALSAEEIKYLLEASAKLQREFTDVELFGFGQINSEHCRHKIFRGKFIVDGKERTSSLFDLIKKTSKLHGENIVSAYKDNVAFIAGPEIALFAPEKADKPSFYVVETSPSIISIKAETHNFPTTVEPFYGASTGSGGEIRDRLAGGTGSIPLSGTAVYMTSYPRFPDVATRTWQNHSKERSWRYQTPSEILIKASNGASDFGNKIGQPLLTGSVLTFEMPIGNEISGFDRCIMLAGGVGFTKTEFAQKKRANKGDKIILLGGENYRIGMGGGSVSSVESGKYGTQLELSAIQRANPEMQKRVLNVVRSLVESDTNPILLIHDHGAGGHMNCFVELIEEVGGKIEISKLPVGDPSLSTLEILCNESQERIGLIVKESSIPLLTAICSRERCPCYVIGEVTADNRVTFVEKDGSTPVDLPLETLLGSSPTITIEDSSPARDLTPLKLEGLTLEILLPQVLSLEAVGCKDWLTNKVDRSVSGLVAQQQCVGALQLPLADYSITALDYLNFRGISTALGHAPGAGLIDAKAGSILSIAEALTNIVFSPLKNSISSVALSANWMWPGRQPGEDARLYYAVEACSDFACALGVPIPTGKDSLSMTMKYEDQTVKAPGTVIITAVSECDDFRLRVTPELKETGSCLLYINFSGDLSGANGSYPLGGSSLAQVIGEIGDTVPEVNAEYFKRAFDTIQLLIRKQLILAGHDISAGGMITTLTEMCIVGDIGATLNFAETGTELLSKLFSEKPGVIIEVSPTNLLAVEKLLNSSALDWEQIGITGGKDLLSFSLTELFKNWYQPSLLLDSLQVQPEKAKERMETVHQRKLCYKFPKDFSGITSSKIDLPDSRPTAVVLREQGTNGEREMAFALFNAGFRVKDLTMTDLKAGASDLDDAQFLVFPGGFAHADVCGAARGWAATFKFEPRAAEALRRFYERTDTLSLGVCNGCQLMANLDLLGLGETAEMNWNESKKFESIFLQVKIEQSASILLKPLVGSELGVWISNGEGRFNLTQDESSYNIPMKYITSSYPGNPNGSSYNVAALCTKDGRHLAMMPHLERSVLPWQWGYYPRERATDKISPWMLAFQEAFRWCSGF